MNIIPQSGVASSSPLYLHVPPIDNLDPFSPKCEEVTSKLFAQVYQDFRTVVENMGGNVSQITINHELEESSDSMFAKILRPCVLSINSMFLSKLNGCGTPSERRMALGGLAHEIAHRILKHTEKVLNAFSRMFQIPISKKESETIASDEEPLDPLAKRMANEYLANKQNDPVYQHSYEKFIELQRSQEVEADLLTITVPMYARGMRDLLCTELITQVNSGMDLASITSNAPSDIHPTYFDRCKYMTDALCYRYPRRNRDICP